MSVKTYRDAPVKEYLDDLAAKLPAPGGGSAAALTAALGQALVSMVINFTVGKPKYEKYDAELKGFLDTSEKLRREFLGLVDRDVAAFNSKDVRQALDIPLMIARLCFEGMKFCTPLIGKGNVNLISDVAVAAVLLESAFASAYYNVEINLKTFTDPKFVRQVRKELERKKKAMANMRKSVEVKVGKIIRG
jgi:formiminotetrahydrofolate cyclodeaminase